MKKAIGTITLVLIVGGVVSLWIWRNAQSGRTSVVGSHSDSSKSVEHPEAPESNPPEGEYDWITRERGSAPDPPKVELLQVAGTNYYRSGGLLVITGPDHFEVRLGNQSDRLDFDSLAVTDRDCEGYPGILSCDKRPGIFAFDEPRNRLLLDVSTGSGKNVPKVIVAYNLMSHIVTRYGKDYGVILENAAFSKTGRYLAYDVGWAAGVCAFSSQPKVVDTETRKIARLPVSKTSERPEVIQAGPARWVGNNVLEYDVFEFNREDCGKNPDGSPIGKTTKFRVSTDDMEFETEAGN